MTSTAWAARHALSAYGGRARSAVFWRRSMPEWLTVVHGAPTTAHCTGLQQHAWHSFHVQHRFMRRCTYSTGSCGAARTAPVHAALHAHTYCPLYMTRPQQLSWHQRPCSNQPAHSMGRSHFLPVDEGALSALRGTLHPPVASSCNKPWPVCRAHLQ